MGLIKKPSELDVKTTIKTLIYGQPGSGKSTLALSSESPLLLDFDNGVHRVDARYQTDTLQVNSWDQVIEVINNEDLSDYNTLVIDTAGKMLDYMTTYIIAENPKLGKRNGSLTLQGYGVRKVEFINFLKKVSNMGKDLVFVAHDKEERDGDDRYIRPDVGGSSGQDLVRELDLVGYMEMRGKERTISFNPCEKFYGKNTCNLDPVIKIKTLKDGATNDFLSDVFVQYQNNLKERSMVAGEYNDLMNVIDAKLEEVKDAETANDYLKWANSYKDWIWDSKLQASHKINDRAKELKLNFDKKTRQYA